jgi:hypothetical protein
MRLCIRAYAISFLIGLPCFGETAEIIWTITTDRPGQVNRIRPTRDGGFILVGDDLVARLDQDGNVVWEKPYLNLQGSDVIETDAGFLVVSKGSGERINKLLRLNVDGDSLGLAHGSTFLEPAANGGSMTILEPDPQNISGDSIERGYSLLRLDSNGYVLDRWDSPWENFQGAASDPDKRLAMLTSLGGGHLVINYTDSLGNKTDTQTIASSGGYASVFAANAKGGFWAGYDNCYRGDCHFELMGMGDVVDFPATNSIDSDTLRTRGLRSGWDGSMMFLGWSFQGTHRSDGEISGRLVDLWTITTFPAFRIYRKGYDIDHLPEFRFPQFGSTVPETSRVPSGSLPASSGQYYFKDGFMLSDGSWILVGRLVNDQDKNLLAIRIRLPQDPVRIRRASQGTGPRSRKPLRGRSLLGRWSTRRTGIIF